MMDLRRLVTLARVLEVAALSAALGCEENGEAPSATCEAVLADCPSDTGLSPELDPACNEDLRAYQLMEWREPNSPSRQQRLAPRAYGVAAIKNFAPGMNAGEQALTAWLSGDEAFRLDLELTLGSEENDVALERGYGVLLLDGLVHTTVQFGLRPGDVIKTSFEAAAKAISPGAHSASLLTWTARGAILSSTAFTILKESATFVERPQPADTDVVRVADDTASDAYLSGSYVSLRFGGGGPPDVSDGKLELDVLVVAPVRSPACRDLRHRELLVAFVDNEQVSVGDLGMRPAFELREGEAASFHLTFVGLPVSDGELHTLQLWQLSGDGAYAEAPAGAFSQWWSAPSQVARLAW